MLEAQLEQPKYRQIEVDDSLYSQGLRVIIPREKRIMEDWRITGMGIEMVGFLTPGHSDYDPSVDYCVNLEGVTFLTSAALGKLISMTKKHQKEREKNLRLAEVDPGIAEVFNITPLHKIFDSYKKPEDCLEERAGH